VAVERSEGVVPSPAVEGDVVAALRPNRHEASLFKPRYSAFDQTPLVPMLEHRRSGV
jgi:isochorismate hydrolase